MRGRHDFHNFRSRNDETVFFCALPLEAQLRMRWATRGPGTVALMVNTLCRKFAQDASNRESSGVMGVHKDPYVLGAIYSNAVLIPRYGRQPDRRTLYPIGLCFRAWVLV